MKRTILYLLCALSACPVYAQHEEPAVTLDEVAVKGAKVVNKIDGQMIYPTDAQKNASNNGYGMLQKLSLPGIRVDDVAHTISALDGRGSVQLRINGIIVGMQEMLALDPKLIRKIDFINNPGLRYGEGIAYVINILTRRDQAGYTVGTDVTSTLTSWKGNGMAYGKHNYKKSEFSVSYNIYGNHLKGAERTELAHYTLNNGSIYTMERNDVENTSRMRGHDVRLTYNLADTTAYVFQATLSDGLGKTPGYYSLKSVSDPTTSYLATSKGSNRWNSPVLDLYFFRQVTPGQSVTANAVGTFISTRSSSYYDEVSPYAYGVKGRTASALSEVIYENRLKPFTLSAGLNHRYKYTRNRYTEDASALSEMNQHNVYAFGDIRGAVRAFRYSLGLGGSYIHYGQNQHDYDFWTFHPKASLAYNLMQGMQLRYTFEMEDRASRIAMTSDATIRTNSMEYTVGNPDLRPSRDTEQAVRLSYSNSRWYTFADAFYKHCRKPNMAHYERTDDDKFLYTQINQKAIDLLRTMLYASYWVLPEKLQVSAYGGLQRCFNFGYDYTHCYTSWFWTGDITAYLGHFTLRAYTDSGSRWLEGEARGYVAGYTVLQASYRHKGWQFSLSWSNPLVRNFKTAETELLNCHLHKLYRDYSRDAGNSLSLNVSWRMSRGRKHQAVEKTIHLKDTDNGIIKP